MSLKTNWGYTLPNTDALPDMITAEEFDILTAGKYAGDVRIAGNIAAASSAIRNYCGWHVSPPLPCVLKEHLLYGDGRIKRIYDDFIIQLPATHVSEVTAVKIDDIPVSAFTLDGSLVYVFGVQLSKISRQTEIEVDYIAGISDGMAAGIRELIAHRVTHALASSAGVQSETAGGVSITYSANWINSARSTALASDNKEVIDPYRVQGVY